MKSQNTSRRFDIVVVGAGMVGAAAASLLARSGFSVAVVEQAEPAPFEGIGIFSRLR
jgi:2-octaprenyl-3-methyl-6-methoxy-1,4-benzoquinol hydroxylase